MPDFDKFSDIISNTVVEEEKFPTGMSDAERMRNYRQRKPTVFVGIDGEGVTDDDGKHTYVLLSIGVESLHANGRPLATDQILQFIWEYSEKAPDAAYVGYFLAYDFAHWARGFTAGKAWLLYSDEGVATRRRKDNHPPRPVRWQDWEIDILADRRLRLRKRGADRWVYVCDAGHFFQTSLLKAIDPKETATPIVTQAEFDIIRAGKMSRASAKFSPEMIRYNVAENQALASLMESLDEGLRAMGVKLRRNQWFGPGQAAQQWLRSIRAPTGEKLREVTPNVVLEALRASYYSGWFEVAAHGIIPGKAYQYDENSAYPHTIAQLPCFSHGTWTHNAAFSEAPFHIVYARVSGDNKYYGAMLHRTPQGRVLRPRTSVGWYWCHELGAAMEAGFINDVDVFDGWRFSQTCNHLPFFAIADLYQDRLRVGKKTPIGKAYKLVYNSVYGKLAQSVGEPKYGFGAYASLITAGCRTAMLQAIASHPRGAAETLMIATDSVTFRSPHPTLTLSDRLGEWSVKEHPQLSLFKPGMYWDETAYEGGELRSRGVAREEFQELALRIDLLWVTRAEHFFSRGILERMWPTVNVPVKFGFVSPKLAVARRKWDTVGSLATAPVVHTAEPSDKRDILSQRYEGSHLRESTLWTEPYNVAFTGVHSTPYDKRFGDELREDIAHSILDPDYRVFTDALFEEVNQ